MTKKQLILAAVAGLVLGIGGGTAFAIAQAPDAPLPLAAVTADSLAVDSTAHALAADSSPAPARQGASAVPADSGHAAPPPAPPQDSVPVAQVPASPPRTAAAATIPADSTSVRLARIFGAMKPEEAAAVLSRLDDADVKLVLFQLSDRKAAEILARFPGERAATLTRTMLTDARTH